MGVNRRRRSTSANPAQMWRLLIGPTNNRRHAERGLHDVPPKWWSKNHSLWSRFEPRFVTARFHQNEVIYRNIPDSSFRYVSGQLPGDGQWKRWEACHRGTCSRRLASSGMGATPAPLTQIFKPSLAVGGEPRWDHGTAPRSNPIVRRVTSPVS